MKAKRTADTPNSVRNGLLTMLVLAGLLLTVTLLRHCAGLSVPLVEPLVVLERSQGDDSSKAQTAPTPVSLPDDGEVYRTANRLREASALAVAAALFTADETAKHVSIRSTEALIAGVRSAGLLPPGVIGVGGAMLQSASSRLSLRFRAEPIAIEVLSLPHAREDGPAMLIRIPGVDASGQDGSIFIADRLGEIDPPLAFAPVNDCVRAGWIDQSFAQSEVSEAEQQQLRAWLAARHSRQ